MVEDEIAGVSVGEFGTVAELVTYSLNIQIALAILIIGLIIIITVSRIFTHWIKSQKINYVRPYVSNTVRYALLPFLAIALVTSVNVYIQAFELFGEEVAIASENDLTPRETFSKILDTINILVIGFTISRLVPVAIDKRDRSILERDDYEIWFDMHGFSDDEDGLFQKLFKWIPPKTAPHDMKDEEFKKYLETKEGLEFLEKYRTTKGLSVGTYEELVEDPFVVWKKSERSKYEKYFKNCITGDNQTGKKLKPGAVPEQIYPIDVWREQKRQGNFSPIIPSARPPGYARKQEEGVPKSAKKIFPVGIFIATVIGIVSWWGIDLVVLATATGGIALGIGLALKDTMENYFAYIVIKKDKVVKVGDRITLPSGYNGLVYKITPRVTYVRHGLNESLAVIPTKQLVSAEIINFTKEFKLVPATIEVGVSYLNNPKQVEAILIKIGKRAMKEVKDLNGNHLAKQKRCPYLDERKQSCGCDKNIHVNVSGPVVRFNNFNDSSLDFALRVFVRDYGSQFKMKSEMRVIMYEEFKKFDIRIPWPIRTVYQGDEKREAEEIGKLEQQREKVVKEYDTPEGIGAVEDD